MTPWHPLVRDTRDALRKTKPDEDGRVTAAGPGVVRVSVSSSQIERALLLLNEVLRQAKTHDVEVAELTPPGQPSHLSYGKRHSLGLRSGDDTWALRISERFRRIDHVKTPDELRREKTQQYPWIRRYDYEPRGVLTIAIGEVYGGLQWSDKKSAKLEDRLPEVFAGVHELSRRAAEQRERRKAEADAAQRLDELYAKARAAAVEDATAAWNEDLRGAAAVQQAQQWQNAQLLREYGAALSQTFGHWDTQAWIMWIQGWADAIDPLHNRPVSPDDRTPGYGDLDPYLRDWPPIRPWTWDPDAGTPPRTAESVDDGEQPGAASNESSVST
jgi:hypothetical protein